MMEDMLEGTGLTLEDALKASGVTMEELVAGMNLDSLVDEVDFASSGVYDAKEGKLYMTDGDTIDESEYAVYELADDELKLIELSGTDMEEMEEVITFPMVFVRQK